jgi:glycosyltransferase involved in cell wall biosynthesis
MNEIVTPMSAYISLNARQASSRRRLFICDPVCAQPFGHNVTALRYFRSVFTDKYSEVVAVCSRKLPRQLVADNDFIAHYNFYYQRYIPLPDDGELVSESSSGPLLRFIDKEEDVATSDAVRFLDEFHIGEHDTLMFPSVDFYGLVGLFNALQMRQGQPMPRLLLRFIAVMERATPTYPDPLSELIDRIEDAREAGIPMAISAETPRWADHLATLLNTMVSVTPYPDVATPLEMSEAGPFVFYCPGSARHDKGFMSLLQIFRGVRVRDRALEIRFVTQVLPYRESAQQQSYISQLYAIPGVELLEPTISAEEMLANYRNCNAILLPYDAAIYQHRGSAVLMEAACLGRPVIALDGSAFSEQVRYYGLGIVVPTIEAMIEEAYALAERPRRELIDRARQARYRFLADVESGYEQWLKVLE